MKTIPGPPLVEFLPLPIEYELLERAQNGDKAAVLVLTLANLYFLKRLARKYSPEENEDAYEEKLRQLVNLLWIIAPLILEAKEQICLLESVYIAFLYFEENPKEKISQRDCREYRAIWLASNPTSLDAALGSDGETTFGEILVGSHPHYEEALWPEQVRSCIRAHLADSRFTEFDRQLIEWYYFEEIELQEIARRTNRPQHSIREKIAKICRELRRRLPEDMRHYT